MAPSRPQNQKSKAGHPRAYAAPGHTAPNFSTLPAHSSARSTHAGRHYILPGPSPAQPRPFKPIRFKFDWRRLPSLPAIRDFSLTAVVSGYVKPDVMELALEGDGFLSHALTQAVLAACPGRALREIGHLRNHLVSNVTFSHLALSYRLVQPNLYHCQKRYADVFEAHIGALYREAKTTGRQAEVEALVAAMFGADVWPVLRRGGSASGKAKGATGTAQSATSSSGFDGGEGTDEPVFLHHARHRVDIDSHREVIDLTGLDGENEDDLELSQPLRVAGQLFLGVSVNVSHDINDSDDIDNDNDNDNDDTDDTDDIEEPATRSPSATHKDHAPSQSSATVDPGLAAVQPQLSARQRRRRRRMAKMQAHEAVQRTDVDRAATKRAKRAK